MTAYNWSDIPIVGDEVTCAEADLVLSPTPSVAVPRVSCILSPASMRRLSLECRRSILSSQTKAGQTTTKRNKSVSMKRRMSKTGKKKTVTFSNVLEFRLLPITLGIHPRCPRQGGGMAIQCDWYQDEAGNGDGRRILNKNDNIRLVSLDKYERNAPKRSPKQFRLSYHERCQKLCRNMNMTRLELLQQEADMLVKESSFVIL